MALDKPYILFSCMAISLLSMNSEGFHITMQPLLGKAESIGGKDAVIIIIPENGLSHNSYTVLGRIIQQLYPLRLWVSLLDTSREETLTLDNLPLLLMESVKKLANEGLVKTADVFLAVHGHRGHVIADYAQAVPATLSGLILFGTFLPKRFSFESFPLPVLTIVGEIDGVVRITHLAQTIRSVIEAHESQPGLASHSPIVVLEGANHDVFTLGDLPSSMRSLDIESEVAKDVAMKQAANLTAIFIASVRKEPNRFVDIANVIFPAEFERVVNLTEPIRSLMEMTQDNLKSYWVKAAQKWLSGLEGKHSTQLEVDSFVVANQNHLPPVLVKEHGINYVLTFSAVVRSLSSDDTNDNSGENPEAPDEIAARMLGPERIREYLGNTTIARNYTCRDLNYASFMTAYHTASEKARQRYNNYHRGVIFEPDIVTDSEALWETTRLKLKTVSRVLHVTSVSYQTENNKLLSEYAGLFFCKLLPPDRALEWIYVDSLRRAVTYADN